MNDTYCQSKRVRQGLYDRIGFIVLAAGLATSVAQSQSATVTGKVETPDKETTKANLKVLAIPKFDGAKVRSRKLTDHDYNHTTHVYSYKIDRLQPGLYDFVVCDGLDYKPELQSAVIESGQGATVSFLLHDQTKGDIRIANELRQEGLIASEGVPVFLKHVRSGCIVAETATNKKGQYEFLGLPKEDYVVSFYEYDQ
jgi:hypothetical protein